MPELKLKEQTSINMGWGFLCTAVIGVIGLLLPPILFKSLGAENYGIWSLLVFLGTFIQYFDFGLTTSLAKNIAHLHSLNEYVRLSRLTLFTIFGSILLCSFMVLTWVLGQSTLVRFFFPKASLKGLGSLGAIFLMAASVDLLANILGGVLQGFQRYDRVLAGNISIQICKAVVTVGVLILRGGVWGLALVQLVTSCLRAILLGILAKREGLIIGKPGKLNTLGKSDLRHLAKLGINLQSAQIMGLASNQIVRILIVRMVGIEASGFYDLANKLAVQLATLPDSIYIAIMPAISRMSALSADESIQQLVKKSMKFLLLIGLPACLFVGWFAPEIIAAWLGVNNASIVFALRILLLGNFINVLTGPIYHALIGIGKPMLGLWKAILWLSLNSSLTVFLGYRYHYVGILVGSTIALVGSSLLVFIESERRYAFGLVNVLVKVSGRSGGIAFLGLLLVGLYNSLSLSNGHKVGIVGWVSLLAIYLIAYMVTHWLIGTILPDEKRLARSIVSTGFKQR